MQEPTPETLPNYDEHDDGFEEQSSQRGKYRKLFTESSNLGKQRKMIVDKVFYDTAYKNISQFGICLHNPPTCVKKFDVEIYCSMVARTISKFKHATFFNS